MMKKTCALIAVIMCIGLLSTAANAATTLRFAIQNSEASWGSVVSLNPWLEEVAALTKDEVKIEPYYNNTLLNSRDAWTGTKNGIADMAWCVQGYWPGITPLVEVVTLPGLPFETGATASYAAYQLLEEFPEIAAEFRDFQPLIFHVDFHVLMTAKKEIKSVDDLKGMKIRILGGPPTTQFLALKASPILMPMPDVYMSVQKGVLDGMDVAYEAGLGFRFYELIDYYMEAPLCPAFMTVLVNKRKWDTVPAAAREAIMSLSGKEGSAKWAAAWTDLARDELYKIVAEKRPSAKITALEGEALKQWNEVSVYPVHEEWVAAMEKKGFMNARQILERTIELGELSKGQ